MSALYCTPSTRPCVATWMTDLASYLPANYQEQAKELKAFVRARKLTTVDDLFRALLCWAFVGLSLRQLGIWGTLQHVGDLSDRAWSKRLVSSQAWVLWLLSHLVSTASLPSLSCRRRLRVVDASMIRGRSVHGHHLRFHTSYLLNEQRIDEMVLTTHTTAECMTHFTWKAGDIVLADRGYCRRTQITFLRKAQVDFIIRWHSVSVPLQTRQGAPFSVIDELKAMTGPSAQYLVSDGKHDLRFIALRLSERQAEKARKRCQKAARKCHRGHLKETTFFLAGWLLLLTSLKEQEATCSQILLWYRARWQVELLFKRIKQFLQVHRFPSFHEHHNQVRAGLIICGWLLLEAYQQTLTTRYGALESLWQGQSLLVRTFQQLVLGTWSLATLSEAWPLLQRYFRSGRSLEQRWSHVLLLSSLDNLPPFVPCP